MNIEQNLKKFKRLPLLSKMLIIIMAILLIYKFYNKYIGPDNLCEGFGTDSPFTLKTDGDIYDSFYCKLYDELTYNRKRVKYEVDAIIEKTNLGRDSLVLDIGSGTGNSVAKMNEKGIPCIGIDRSKDMINMSINKYEKYKNNFLVADVNNSNILGDDQVTHITCLNYTIYYIKDKRLFFENCNKWIFSGGYLIIHITNNNKIPQEKALLYLSESKDTGIIPFDDFEYSVEYKKNKNNTDNLIETFKQDNKIIQNEHTFYLNSPDEINGIALENGFNLVSLIDLKECQYNNHHLYIYQKQNI